MKVLLPVIGTRGDVQLSLTLANELKKREHMPLMIVTSDYSYLCEYYDIPHITISVDPNDGIETFRAIMNASNDLKAAKIGTEQFNRGVKLFTDTIQEYAPEYDLIVCYGDLGKAEAVKYGKPFVRLVVDPSMAEKTMTKSIGANIKMLMESIAVHALMGKEYDKFSKQLGVTDIRSHRAMLTLIPMSEHLIQRQDNWTERDVMDGFWYLDSETKPLTKELLDFLARTDKLLVLFAFGSAGTSENDPDEMTRLIQETVKDLNIRALIVNTLVQGETYVSDDIMLIHDVPYHSVMSYFNAVVHHCGLGTTAEVLRGGIPSVPVPYMIDQFQWAQRIHQKHVAVKPISRKDLTQEKLTAALRLILQDESIKNAAKELAAELNKGKGIFGIVEKLEVGMIERDESDESVDSSS